MLTEPLELERPQTMTTPTELEALKQRLYDLQLEHRDLDDVVARLQEDRSADQLAIQRLKKRKLLLKDRIEQLKSLLIPDLDA